jgi:Uma2 family endonuclease
MVVANLLPSIDEQISGLLSNALYEIVNGEVVEVAPMGMLATSFASVLVSLINGYAMPLRLGLAITEGLYRFRADRPQRRPDVSFIPASRWPANVRRETDPPAMNAVPSLAVEVISPSNTAAEIEEKRLEYLEAGISVVWVVYPIPRTIYVHESPNDCRLIDENGVLDGGVAIPGFKVKVADIFACIPLNEPSSANGIH